MRKFVLSEMRDGMMTDEAGTSPIDKGIGIACRGRSHNAIIRYLDGVAVQAYHLTTPPGWYVGNAEWPHSAWQPMVGDGSLENEMNDQSYPRDVRIVWPVGATEAQGKRAAARFVPGVHYDISPYIRKILQLIGLFNPLAAALAMLIPNISKWLYCTEACRNCWLPEGIDPWLGNQWADPGHTVDAEDAGRLEVIHGAIEDVP